MGFESFWKFKPYEINEEISAGVSIDDQIKIKEYDLESIRNEYQIQKNFALSFFLALFIPITLYLVLPYFPLQVPRTWENFLIVCSSMIVGFLVPFIITAILINILMDMPFERRMDEKTKKIIDLMKKGKRNQDKLNIDSKQ